MYTKTLILLALAGVAVSRDVSIGSTKHGVKIFDEKREASPAIWRQKEDVKISVNDTDVISAIVIKDARPEKDGEARIVDGGVGHQNATIQLKSPTVFRGYDFHIEVYAVPENEYVLESNDTTDSPVTTSTDAAPKITEKELGTTSGPVSVPTVVPGGEKVNIPAIVGKEDKEQTRQNRHITEETTSAKPESTPTTLKPEVSTIAESSSTTLKPQESTTTESTSTPTSVTEQEASSTPVGVGSNYGSKVSLVNSAHGAQITGFRPKFVEALPSHPLVVATDVPSAAKSQHKREAYTIHLVEPLESEESLEDDVQQDDDNVEEIEDIEGIIPKMHLYTTDEFATPVPYNL